MRDEWRGLIEATDDTDIIGAELLKLDRGISLPMVLRLKEVEADDDNMEVEGEGGEGEGEEDKQVKRMRLMQFKFWPNLDMRESWKQYLFRDTKPSISSLYIACKILTSVTE